jgi:hypothetical protein
MRIEIFEETALSKLYFDSVKISARKYTEVLRFFVKVTAHLPLGRDTKFTFSYVAEGIYFNPFKFLDTLREINNLGI